MYDVEGLDEFSELVRKLLAEASQTPEQVTTVLVQPQETPADAFLREYLEKNKL